MKRILLLILFGAVAWHSPYALGDDRGWEAGVARVNITPELPIWLSGYAARDKPAQDKLDELWAKALVLQDRGGRRVLLVTMDLIGIDRDFSREICRRLEDRYQLPRSAIALATSHTHSGPVVGLNLAPMFELDPRQRERIETYTQQLADKLVGVVGEALQTLAPAKLSWGNGTAMFAVNRRNNPEAEATQRRAEGALIGPVDHDVPVLAIHDAASRLRAVVCGYACHATVLDDLQVSADWPGVAQRELEAQHPGATVLFWAGCGADQNPLPRRSVEFMNQHGRALADAVDDVLRMPLVPVTGSIRSAYEEIDLAFGSLPSREELQTLAAGPPPRAAWAKYLLTIWERDGQLPSSYPYPIQAWRLGKEFTWFFLGGEVVVDYSLRLKSELGSKETWITSYANDVMGYIPSRRVLAEGGYEGGESRIYYGLPAVWAESVEETIVRAAKRLKDSD